MVFPCDFTQIISLSNLVVTGGRVQESIILTECGFTLDQVSVRLRIDAVLLHLQQLTRVDRVAEVAKLEMEVRSCGTSRITTKGDHITRLHLLSRLHQHLGEVSVQRLQAIVVADHDEVAVALLLHAHTRQAHHAVESRAHRVAHLEAHIRTCVETSPTLATLGGDQIHVRRIEATAIHQERVRHGVDRYLIRIHTRTVPDAMVHGIARDGIMEDELLGVPVRIEGVRQQILIRCLILYHQRV